MQVSREKEPDIIKRKKKEQSPDLVRSALAPLVPYIRLEYILPTNDQYLSKICQSGIIEVPTSIDPNSTTIGKGWEYGNQRLPRYFQPIVQIFLELNDGEWIEEVYNGIETVPRNYDNSDNRQIDKPLVPLDLQTPSRTETDLNNNEFLIYNNIIIPNEQITTQVLKRLHQLQQKFQPSIPRHLHYLRIAVLREFGLPESLIHVIRDPCQYYPNCKNIRRQFGIVQGFRYYRKLREVASSPPLSVKQPDVTACSTTPIGSPRSLSDDTYINHHPQSSRSCQKTERNSLSSVKPFSARLLDLTRINSTVGSRKKTKNDRVDYVPINKGDTYDQSATLEFALPDCVASGRNGIENLTYRNDSSTESENTS